ASTAFPSSSNTSTLSESAVGRLGKPCKSPASPSRCSRRSPEGNGTVSTTKPVLVTLFLFAENFLLLAREDRLEAAFILLGFLFADVRLEGALFRAFLFGVVRFFLFGMWGSLPLIFAVNYVKSAVLAFASTPFTTMTSRVSAIRDR